MCVECSGWPSLTDQLASTYFLSLITSFLWVQWTLHLSQLLYSVDRKTWFVKNLLILIYLYTHSSAVCNQISKPSSVVYVALPGRISFFLFQRQKLYTYKCSKDLRRSSFVIDHLLCPGVLVAVPYSLLHVELSCASL